MTKIKHEFQVIVYSDTDFYPNMTPLDIGQLLQDYIRVVLNQKGVGYDRSVFHRGYQYLTDDTPEQDK